MRQQAQQVLGQKLMLESSNLMDSVQVRALDIVRQLLASGKAKDDDGVKIFKEPIEEVKLE